VALTLRKITILPMLVGFTVGVALAQSKQGGELGIQLGALAPDRDLSGRSQDLSNIEPMFGIRGDYEFAPLWGWFTDASLTVFETTQAGDVTNYAIRTGFELFHRPHWTDYQTFFTLGGGWLAVDRDRASDFSRWFGSISTGQRFTAGANQLIRWELRVDHTLTDEDLGGEPLTTPYLVVAYTWGMPSRARDSDGDGVIDRKDDCPGTPRGVLVDAYGCPRDTDGDGVFDGIDQCPDTQQGWPVDSVGCPLDTDEDGVADGIDACPGTPFGVHVDERGCPLDSDGDGMFDGIDQCPDTPQYAHVDSRGCPLDSDGDGVFDGIDRCPQTPSGTAVDEFGCPLAQPLFEEERRTLILEGVFFEFNSAKLTLNSKEILDEVAESLLAWPEVRVEIGGHTDSLGADEYNQRLSRSRAESVRDYLLERGVPRSQLEARGYGEAQPIADNRTEEGRAKNRRVELKRLD
jgi:outer membrane protein OmpA-like peptidoglycan-associated protein